MKIQESGENYLETILILGGREGFVRSVDVASELGFTKASVSRAMGILRAAGYIDMPKNGTISLTEEGYQKASKVYERHRVTTDFLRRLGVSAETAEKDACRIEHVISEEAFEAMRAQVTARG
ncbi:MAG TPA: metal-dependent transcriptional regulator [Candidatus Fimivivens faecavium]|nr:metal-dependent transcriptional regulator [Candidatus Fimivivens faecavium]